MEDLRTRDANPRQDPHASNASDSAVKQTPTASLSDISTQPLPDATVLPQQFPPDEQVPETTLGIDGPPTPGRILFGEYEVIRELG
ncbi:MAG: hypothetical protein JO116_06035, partial [Planctomycetaceae bacterium]|nr:hypothetical protein [Planctomycetaceae bacterium]